MKYKTITLPVTKVRDQLFDLVNAGYYAGQQVKITKGKKVVARLVPEKPEKEINWKSLEKALQQTAGMFSEEDEKFILEGRKNFDRDLGDW